MDAVNNKPTKEQLLAEYGSLSLQLENVQYRMQKIKQMISAVNAQTLPTNQPNPKEKEDGNKE